MVEIQAESTPPRSALYVDGFNLYHSVIDLNDNFLKWCNLWKLAEIFSKAHKATVKKVVFCTAVPDAASDSRDRHLTYNAALVASGVQVLKRHHIITPEGKRLEKQSDINLALALIMDGEDNVYDIAYLLSGDSDQAATGRVFKERFHPAKILIGVGTPSRPVAEKLTAYTHSNFEMTRDHLDMAVLPALVPGLSGNFIRRPDAYEPAAWWVHPDDRP